MSSLALDFVYAATVLPATEPPYDALVSDVAPDGALIVTLPDGRSLPLASAEISLRAK